MARMIRDAKGLEKIALIDRIARDTHTGRSLFIAWGRGPDGRVSAPAAFSIAAQASKPLTDELGGRRPDIPYATPMSFSVGLITRGLDGAEIPYVHQHPDDPSRTIDEARQAIGFYEDYSRPLSLEERFEALKALTDAYVDRPAPQDEVAVKGAFHEVTVDASDVLRHLDSRLAGPVNIHLERSEDVDKLPQPLPDNVVCIRSGEERFRPEEIHESVMGRPELPPDVRESFWWLSSDAADRAATDANGLEARGAGADSASPPGGAGPQHDAHSIKRWWEE